MTRLRPEARAERRLCCPPCRQTALPCPQRHPRPLHHPLLHLPRGSPRLRQTSAGLHLPFPAPRWRAPEILLAPAHFLLTARPSWLWIRRVRQLCGKLCQIRSHAPSLSSELSETYPAYGWLRTAHGLSLASSFAHKYFGSRGEGAEASPVGSGRRRLSTCRQEQGDHRQMVV